MPDSGTLTEALPNPAPTWLARSAFTLSAVTALATVVPFSPLHERNTTALPDSANVLAVIVGLLVPQARIPTDPLRLVMVLPVNTGLVQFMMWIASLALLVIVLSRTTMSVW